MCSILIAADICPIERNRALLQAGDAKALFSSLLPDFNQADVVLANLECPLVESPSPIPKTGPSFSAPPECITGVAQAGIKLLCLANNHILDQGADGLRSTLKACEEAGIATFGAGENLSQARRILVQSVDGLRVGFLAMAEHEFSIASEKRAGANPLDLIDYIRNVRARRSDFDYLIVLLHGGDEFQPISPRVQNLCRFLIEMGANAVIVQHPHALGGYEDYQGGHIVYGQGALLMDEALYRESNSFHEGFLVKLDVASDFSSTMDIIPFGQSDPDPGARRMTGEREAAFRQALVERSRKIQDPAFVQAEWMEFCRKHRHAYMGCLLGFNRVMHRLNRNGMLTHMLYGKRPLLGVRNIVQCETHREAIQTIFEAEANGHF